MLARPQRIDPPSPAVARETTASVRAKKKKTMLITNHHFRKVKEVDSIISGKE